MKKLLLAFAFLLSFAVASHSDPPEGYQYLVCNYYIHNYHGQLIPRTTATINDYSFIDLEASQLVADSNGEIIIYILIPSDPDVPAPVLHDIQITFRAEGYQDAVFNIDYTSASITMADAD